MLKHMSLREKVLLLIRALSYVWWQKMKLRFAMLQFSLNRRSKSKEQRWEGYESARQSTRQYWNAKMRYEAELPGISSWWWLLVVFDILVAVIAFFIIGWTAWTAFQGLPASMNPELRNVAPTPIAQPGPRQDRTPLQDVVWLSAAEAQALRSQDNVINLVLVRESNVRYAKEITVILDDSWEQVQPLKVASIAVHGTAVQLTTSTGEDFVFNTYQPFVFVDQPGLIHLVDHLGQSWSKQLSDVQLVSLESGQQALPIAVAANVNLSFSN